jgi:hypothetical protein
LQGYVPVEKVVSCTTGSTAAQKKAVLDAKLRHIPCFLHTIALAVQDGLNNPTFTSLIGTFKKIIGFFHSSTVAKKDLCSQRRISGKNVFVVLHDVPTRWNSLFLALERAVLLKTEIDMVLRMHKKEGLRLSTDEWGYLERLCSFLAPFREVTKWFSNAKEFVASAVIPAAMKLLKAFEKWRDEDAVSDFVRDDRKSPGKDRMLTPGGPTVPILTIVDETARLRKGARPPVEDVAVDRDNDDADDANARTPFRQDTLEHAFGHVQRLFASSIEARLRPFTEHKILQKCTVLDPRWKRGYMPMHVVETVLGRLAAELDELSSKSSQPPSFPSNDSVTDSGIFDNGPIFSTSASNTTVLLKSYFQLPNAPLSQSVSAAWTEPTSSHYPFRETVGLLAAKYGGVQGISIEYERVFSAGRLTLSTEREQLKSSTLNNLIIVDRNMESFVLTKSDREVMYRRSEPEPDTLAVELASSHFDDLFSDDLSSESEY